MNVLKYMNIRLQIEERLLGGRILMPDRKRSKKKKSIDFVLIKKER